MRGQHIIVDLILPKNKSSRLLLNNTERLLMIGKIACKNAGVSFTKHLITKYQPEGVSVIIQISESHLSFHTYPEVYGVMIDMFTCGKNIHMEKAMNYIIKKLDCLAPYNILRYITIPRGIEEDNREVEIIQPNYIKK